MLRSLPIVRKQGGWSSLEAVRSSWVPHPFGFWFTKGCGGCLSASSLLQQGRKVPRRVNDPNDLQRFCLRVVHNPVAPVGLHKPEAQRQGSQVFTNTAGERSIRQEAASDVDGLFNAIGCFQLGSQMNLHGHSLPHVPTPIQGDFPP